MDSKETPEEGLVSKMSKIEEVLFGIFEEKMAEMCSVVPSDHHKSIVSNEWLSYIDSLSPHVEAIRPEEYMRGRPIVPRKTGNVPVVEMLAARINQGTLDAILIEDPGVPSQYLPTFGPNLLLVSREFADKVLALGCMP